MFANIPDLARMLRNFAYRLRVPYQQVDDLVQETLCRMCENAHRFDGANENAWAATIMINQWRSQQRHYMIGLRKGIHGDSEIGYDVAGPDDPFVVTLLHQTLDAMEKLNVYQQDTIALRALEYTYEEIASLMGVADGTSKSRYARGIEQLERLTDGEAKEDAQVRAAKRGSRACVQKKDQRRARPDAPGRVEPDPEDLRRATRELNDWCRHELSPRHFANFCAEEGHGGTRQAVAEAV